MSTGSGIADKGDAASTSANASIATTTSNKKDLTTSSAAPTKPNYTTLNINDLYRGKNLEQSKPSVPRHGMQTLGKVVRRAQPSSGLTSVSGDGNSESISTSVSSSELQQKKIGVEANVTPNSNSTSGTLTGSSNSAPTGWATLTSSDSNATPVATGSASQSTDHDVSCLSKPGSGNRLLSTASGSGSTSIQTTRWPASPAAASGNQTRDQAKVPAPVSSSILPAQEFPELGVEEVVVSASKQMESKTQPVTDPGSYGPGPSLRPAISSSWSQGSANTAGANSGTSGNGVNGVQGNTSHSQTAAPGPQGYGQPANIASGAGGSAGFRAPGGQSVQRNAYPGSGASGSQQLGPGQEQPYRVNRSKSTKEEPPMGKFSANIVPEEKISEFDEIVEKGDINSDWTAICDAIDYDQKLNFDLEDGSSAEVPVETPLLSASNPGVTSIATDSSAAVDMKSGRKVHSFEDEFTRSPPNSGRVLYDPRDQKQNRVAGPDNRSSGSRPRRVSERSDDVSNDGRGLLKNTAYGRDSRGGDSSRAGFKQQVPQQQSSQLPPRFQKQFQQQNQQQLFHQRTDNKRFDSRVQSDLERHRRDAPHFSEQQEWRSSTVGGRNESRPNQSHASNSSNTSSAADELNWRSASKKVLTTASESHRSEPRGSNVTPGALIDKEITILKHDKNQTVSSGHATASSLDTSTATASTTVTNPQQICGLPQQSAPKTLPKSETVSVDWASDEFNVSIPTTEATAVVNHWQHNSIDRDSHFAQASRGGQTRSSMTTLGKKNGSQVQSSSSDSMNPTHKNRSDESSWRRKPEEQMATSGDLKNLSADNRSSSGDHSLRHPGSATSALKESVEPRKSECQDQQDKHMKGFSSLEHTKTGQIVVNRPSVQHAAYRDHRSDDRQIDYRVDNRNESRSQYNRRNDYHANDQPQREQRRDNRRRSQEESMTFDYRDLPHPSSKSGRDAGSEGPQFPNQRAESSRKILPGERSSGPVLARVAGNSNYGPPPSKAAFEQRSSDVKTKSSDTLSDSQYKASDRSQQKRNDSDRSHGHVGQSSADNSWKSNRPFVPRDDRQPHNGHRQREKDDQRGSQRSTNNQPVDQRRSQREHRDSRSDRRSDRPEYRTDTRGDNRKDNRGNDKQYRSNRRSPTENDIPPRFRKVRSGTDSSKGSRGGQPEKSRATGNHPESDVGNEEWETASESSHKDLKLNSTLSETQKHKVDSQATASVNSVNKSHGEKKIDSLESQRNGRGGDSRKHESGRHENRRQDGGRDDRKDSDRRKADRPRDDRRNAGRNYDHRQDDNRGNRSTFEENHRRKRDDNKDFRQTDGNRGNRRWQQDGQQSKSNQAIVQQMSQMKLEDPTSSGAAVTHLKKDLKSLSLNDRSDEGITGRDVREDDILAMDRHKKRTKGSADESQDNKKLKQEILHNSKYRHSKPMPRAAKVSGSRDMRLQKLSEDAFKLDPGRLSSLGQREDVASASTSKENAWNKPLSQAQQTRSTVSNTMTTATARHETSHSSSSGSSSKTICFEHQDSGVDVGSDHQASAASSQRSSPNNGAEKKVHLPVKSPLAATVPISEESPEPPVGTMIFENKMYRQHNEALSGISDNQMHKSTSGPRAIRSSAGNVQASHSNQFASDSSNRNKNYPARHPGQQDRSKDVAPRQSMASDLDQKIASVKKVWDDTASSGTLPDMTSENQPAKSKSPSTRHGYPPGVAPATKYPANMPQESSSQMKQTKPQSAQQPQYQRSLSGNFVNSNSPPVNLVNQVSSPPLEAMRQHLSQQQAHYVQSGASHAPTLSTPHAIYNLSTIANMYPAFNQHMDPRAPAQLQAFAQQLAQQAVYHNTATQHSMRTTVQVPGAHPFPATGTPAQMSDFRAISQVAASTSQHQQQQLQQQQQSNLIKQTTQQYLQQNNMPSMNHFQQPPSAGYYANHSPGFYHPTPSQHVYPQQPSQQTHVMTNMPHQSQSYRIQQQQQQSQQSMNRGARSYNH